MHRTVKLTVGWIGPVGRWVIAIVLGMLAGAGVAAIAGPGHQVLDVISAVVVIGLTVGLLELTKPAPTR